MEVCTPEELAKIRKSSMPYDGEGCGEKMYESDTSESSTDSSSLPLAIEEPTAR